MLLTMLEFSQQHEGTLYEIAIRVQNVVNDVGVEDIDPHLRKCYFPNEQYGSKYKYYSYSTCVTDCLKWMQIKICNCTHFNMIYDGSYLIYLNILLIILLLMKFDDSSATTLIWNLKLLLLILDAHCIASNITIHMYIGMVLFYLSRARKRSIVFFSWT